MATLCRDDDQAGIIIHDQELDSDDESVCEYISMSAYGGDADFLLSSAYTIEPGKHQPTFTISVVFFAISAFVIKPLCCLAFLNYYRATGNSIFITSGGIITLVYYIQSMLMIFFIYNNIRVDLLPLRWWQQAVIGSMSVGRLIAFIVIFHSAIFVDSELFFRVSSSDSPMDYITPLIVHTLFPSISVRTVAFMLIIAAAVYVADAICDAVEFVAPRMWVCILMRTRLSF
ncbi:envelope protein UL20 [Felid alphaherpesvirus 1]|uniref:Envelope protein UL20 n=1 Tax=Feline herpesvirus 1 TaxID=10334 RepID=D1FXW2_FHV1|nr:envelope protein UL20 [Felid alphaherpesvirus 1]AMN88972.1 envelope protein UL20 [synthetic construct]ACT88338.1 envelope protein UL20 [Felid alphaherpesvirus 1]ALJ84114.1 envelope protein UL20 [Felid alphaherpesvirus 1]ALJ84190.1 envelope protein UL20 [Felid alphaherpesvirus 1]ALJ84266.1 envelope protein UL20 [Felid alphaherpesvirus 1]